MRARNSCLLTSLMLPLLGCSSSSSHTTTDAGKGDSGGTMHKTDSGTHADSGHARDAATCGNPCSDVSGTCVPIVAGESESDIVTAFSVAKAGTTLAFGAGTFAFTNTLALLGVPNLTVRGAGMTETILDFSGQAAGSDGLDAQDSNHLTLWGFTVQNPKGNAIKVEQSSDVVFEAVKAAWTTPMGMNNGPYGIYPVSVQNLLIENCAVTGASDSGVYVGQSQNAVVRGNDIYGNVAGIEIENTWGAVVENNQSHDNTAGILVFDLPNLPQQGGHDVRVMNNQVVSNNTLNFAQTGDIVSKVPAGTGVLVMANHDVEVAGNTITGSNTVGIAVVSYLATLIPITDPHYYPYPYDVSLHDNTISGSGSNIDSSVAIGLLLASAVTTFPDQRGPDLAYDGAIDPTKLADAGAGGDGGVNANAMNICFKNNGAASTFLDINIQKLEIYGEGDAGPAPADGGPTNLPLIDSFNIAPFTCALPATSQVDGGVTFVDASPGASCDASHP